MKALRRVLCVGLVVACGFVELACPGGDATNNTFIFKMVRSACVMRVSSVLLLPQGAGVDDLDSAVLLHEFITPLEDGVVTSRRIPSGSYLLAFVFDTGDGVPRLLIHNIDLDYTGASSGTLFDFFNIEWRVELRMDPSDCDRGFLDYLIDGDLSSNGSFSVADTFFVIKSVEDAGGLGPEYFGIETEVSRTDL